MSTRHVRIRLDLSPACSVGPGKVALLEAIERSGSISAAARAIGMSYRRAWVLVDELNGSFTEPVTQSSVGGAGGGGVEVTDFGRELVAAYRRLERAVDAVAAKHLSDVAARARPAVQRAESSRGARRRLSQR
jgi:molybdate transport system regulatory protein